MEKRIQYTVKTNNRTRWYDENLTISDILNDLKGEGDILSIRLTFKMYGLNYVNDNLFTNKYKEEFNLHNNKTMYDITLKELNLYKSLKIAN